MKIIRPPFAYYGGKTFMAKDIAALIPQDAKNYIEPFAGSLAVLLRKEPHKCEVVNDLDNRLIRFWRTLRDKPDELQHALTLTPYARAEFEHTLSVIDDPCDDVEFARRVEATAFLMVRAPDLHRRCLGAQKPSAGNSDVIGAGGAAFVFPAFDGADLRAAELQADAVAALWAVGDEPCAVLFEGEDETTLLLGGDVRSSLFVVLEFRLLDLGFVCHVLDRYLAEDPRCARQGAIDDDLFCAHGSTMPEPTRCAKTASPVMG